MLKSELRKLYLEKRKELPSTLFDSYNAQIWNILLNEFDLDQYPYLHTFLPILASREINTFQIIENIRIHFPSCKIIVPKTDFKTKTIQNYLLEKDTTLIHNAWGIPEPQDAELIDEQRIDIVLTPLLCVDQQGYRVGYGGGYYDRFFLKTRKDCLKLGLSLLPPVEKMEDSQEYDIRLDACIHPEGIFWF